MPELPEVETIRRTLQERILHRRIQGVRVSYQKVLRNCTELEFNQALRDREFVQLDRRGKYLIAYLDSHNRVVIHLRMTGRLVVLPRDYPMEKHVSLQIYMSGEEELRLIDQRKFATVYLLQEPGFGPIKGLATLGMEPLEEGFTCIYLTEQVQGRTAAIKSVLLDQRRVAGLGNIYADESLYRAGIFPGRPAGSLSSTEINRLHQSIQRVIGEGIAHRGTTFRDYVDGDGRKGGFQELLRVYGREGEPCRMCGEPIGRVKLAGRSSFYCPLCQR
ncbi:MAG: bifunctional DNA-formamidopyrimidine glycosylase/DNA-(apurinic or apyrimidinic site) lyase [Firmicutes bacterium]|nr:bifunctional DNA-formamidopyrimidine glycosylase/DNA-(apurinic or apyrimidinic site) lyase [Bacillota bacterium]